MTNYDRVLARAWRYAFKSSSGGGGSGSSATSANSRVGGNTGSGGTNDRATSAPISDVPLHMEGSELR